MGGVPGQPVAPPELPEARTSPKADEEKMKNGPKAMSAAAVAKHAYQAGE